MDKQKIIKFMQENFYDGKHIVDVKFWKDYKGGKLYDPIFNCGPLMISVIECAWVKDGKILATSIHPPSRMITIIQEDGEYVSEEFNPFDDIKEEEEE